MRTLSRPSGCAQVLVALGAEGGDVEVVQPALAGQLHVDPQRGSHDRALEIPQELHQHRGVEGVARQHVAQLVAGHESQLAVVVEQVEHPAGDDDARSVDAECRGPRVGVGDDVQRRQVAHVERARRLRVELVEAWELPVVDPDRGAEVDEPQRPLVPQTGQLVPRQPGPAISRRNGLTGHSRST